MWLTPPQGIVAYDNDAKRNTRPKLDPLWRTEGTPTSTLIWHKMPLDGGAQVEETLEYDDDDGYSLMQGQVDRKEETSDEEVNQWYTFLAYLQQTLESQPKDVRSIMAGQLLRYLAHRAVDSYHGYLLGHMGGQVAEATALLVTMREN